MLTLVGDMQVISCFWWFLGVAFSGVLVLSSYHIKSIFDGKANDILNNSEFDTQ